MKENLFSFPGGESSQEEDLFGGIFTDLGSDDDGDNPFAAAAVPPAAQQPELSTDTSSDTPQEGKSAPATPAAPTKSEPPAEPAPEASFREQPKTETAPETPAAPAKKQSAQTPSPSTTVIEEESNPLMAAMDLQEEQNARKAAEPVFAQQPVFSYNGNEEVIEDPEVTFEELRISKAEDFPELDDSQSVTWSVTYGKVKKNVSTPRKTKVSTLKREIEMSKEFMDALKKAKDKKPKCIVTPIVKMQKKGVLAASGYKGVFSSLDEARSSDKTICFIPARDGQVYERRVTGAGEFITPASNVTMLDSIHAGFHPALPRIPYALMEQALSLFRCLMVAGKDYSPLEALVNIYWDLERNEFFLHVPPQVVGKAFVNAELDDDVLLDTSRYLHYADLHSHNNMRAKFSSRDDRDERANRVYMVVGRLDRYFPEITVRICNGGHFQEIRPEEVLEPAPLAAFPTEWLQRIQFLQASEPDLEDAA